MTKEYLVEYRIKNGLLFNRIKELGFETVSDFCEKHKFSYQLVCQFLNLKRTVFKEDGSLDKQAELLLEFFQATPDELFPARQHTRKLLKSKKTFLADEEDLIQIDNLIGCEPCYDQFQIEEELQDNEATFTRLLQAMEGALTLREFRFIKMQHGIDCKPMSFAEIGQEFNISRDRAHQIYERALSIMRHPRKRKFIYNNEGSLDQIKRSSEEHKKNCK